jgi:hypothetical protein
MKKIICYLLPLLLAFSAQAQTKVLDKSARKAPEWIEGSRADYIITTATDGELETAKQRALDNVRKYIIESVAQNVTSSSEGTTNQQTVNDQVVNFLDEYKSTFQTQAAPVPFLKGISASRIEEYYWEKRQDKASGAVTYVYSILYPFPSVELKSLVHEFQKRDKEMYGIYERLSAGIDGVNSVEEIDRAVAELNPVINYLFDDVRKRQAQTLQSNYRSLYDRITFAPLLNVPGEYTFNLLLDGRPITTSQRISLKSDCATRLAAEPKTGSIAVTYDYSGCAWDEENGITAGFRFGGKSVPHRFFFTVKKHRLELWPEKTVYLTAKERDSLATDVEIRMSVHSGLQTPYTVKALTLEVPGISAPILLSPLDISFQAPESTLQVTWNKGSETLRTQNNRLNMLRGNMEVEIEGAIHRIDFSLPFKTNW